MCACKWMRMYVCVCVWATFFWNEWMNECLCVWWCVYCVHAAIDMFIYSCVLFSYLLYVPTTRRGSYTCFSLRSRTHSYSLNTLSIDRFLFRLICSVRYFSFSVVARETDIGIWHIMQTIFFIYCNKVNKYVRASIVSCTFASAT